MTQDKSDQLSIALDQIQEQLEHLLNAVEKLKEEYL